MEKPHLTGYRVIREIARGGMASIYLAKAVGDEESLYAVKIMLPYLTKEDKYIARFKHELKTNSMLVHDNIVKITDYGVDAKNLYMVMEYIDGITLKTLLAKVHQLPPIIAVMLVLEVLKGLQYAHNQGVVHRDLKPSNIMITRALGVKIADFGISKVQDQTRITMTGEVLGTPAYMSPEQAAGDAVTAQADIFSIGVILYEMLSAHNPFLGENHTITIMNVMQKDASPIYMFNPGVPSRLAAIIKNCLNRSKDARYSSVDILIDELEDWIDSELKNFSWLYSKKKPESFYNRSSYLKHLVEAFFSEPMAFIKRFNTNISQYFYTLYEEANAIGNNEWAFYSLYLSQYYGKSKDLKDKLIAHMEKHHFKLPPESFTEPPIRQLMEQIKQTPGEPLYYLRLVNVLKQRKYLINSVQTLKDLLFLFPDSEQVKIQVMKTFGSYIASQLGCRVKHRRLVRPEQEEGEAKGNKTFLFLGIALLVAVVVFLAAKLLSPKKAMSQPAPPVTAQQPQTESPRRDNVLKQRLQAAIELTTTGDYAGANNQLTQLLADNPRADDSTKAHIIYLIGKNYRLLRNPTMAEKEFEKIFKQYLQTYWAAKAYIELAEIYRLQDNPSSAREFLLQALAIGRKLHYSGIISQSVIHLVDLDLMIAQYEAAIRTIDENLPLLSPQHEERYLLLEKKGDIHVRVGNLPDARVLYSSCLNFYQKKKNHSAISRLQRKLSDIP